MHAAPSTPARDRAELVDAYGATPIFSDVVVSTNSALQGSRGEKEGGKE